MVPCCQGEERPGEWRHRKVAAREHVQDSHHRQSRNPSAQTLGHSMACSTSRPCLSICGRKRVRSSTVFKNGWRQDTRVKEVKSENDFCFSDAHVPRWDQMRNLLKDEVIHIGERPVAKLKANWPEAPEHYKINQEMGYCNHQALPKKFNVELSRQCKIIRALNSEKVLLLKSQIDMSLQNFKGKVSQAERDLIVNATTIPVNQKLFIHGSKSATEHIAVGIMKYALYQMENEDERRFGCPSLFFGSFDYLAQLRRQLYDRYAKQHEGFVDIKVDLLVDNVEYMIIYGHSNQTNKFMQYLHNEIDEIIKIRPQMNFIICSTSQINQCSKTIQENFKYIEIK